jgi:NADH:ubiquinone oxidoreductase subunit 6 (subunit J)
MAKEKSGMSGVLTFILAIVVFARIVMIMGRNNQGNSRLENWDNTYLIWSIFFLFAIVGSYFWSNRKGKKENKAE